MKRPAFGGDELYALQRNTFDYFWKETNPENGLLAVVLRKLFQGTKGHLCCLLGGNLK
jgi:hypothetical protein